MVVVGQGWVFEEGGNLCCLEGRWKALGEIEVGQFCNEWRKCDGTGFNK